MSYKVSSCIESKSSFSALFHHAFHATVGDEPHHCDEDIQRVGQPRRDRKNLSFMDIKGTLRI